MSELYSIVADPYNAEIFTLMLTGLICFAYLSFVWGNAQRLGNELSTFEWAQVYGLGLLVFLCGASGFGKVFFPANADVLLEAIGLENILRYLTVRFQIIALAIIRAMI